MDVLDLLGLEFIRDDIQWLEAQLLTLANPDAADVDSLPTRSWTLTKLEDALPLAVGYLVFVFVMTFFMKTVFGPKEGESIRGSVIEKFTKEPIQLIMLVYNAIQVILCGYMCVAAAQAYMKFDYKPICNDFSLKNTGMAAIVHVFYLSKVLDFFDTIFIIFRRKWKQLSFLHVYHHFSIFLFYWLNVNVAYDGDIYVTVVLNSFIHLVMYFYYGCRTLNISVPKPIKQLVTHAQRIQFICMMTQAAILLFMGCAYPPRVTVAYLVYILSLFLLFTDFDRKEYGSKDGSTKGTKKAQ